MGYPTALAPVVDVLQKMETDDLIKIIFGLFAALVLSVVMRGRSAPPAKPHVINDSIKKDQPKVVDKFTCGEIEDLCTKQGKDKCVYCRCWKSKNFPYCDGSHTKHNDDTGDNTGPLIIEKTK